MLQKELIEELKKIKKESTKKGCWDRIDEVLWRKQVLLILNDEYLKVIETLKQEPFFSEYLQRALVLIPSLSQIDKTVFMVRDLAEYPVNRKNLIEQQKELRRQELEIYRNPEKLDVTLFIDKKSKISKEPEERADAKTQPFIECDVNHPLVSFFKKWKLRGLWKGGIPIFTDKGASNLPSLIPGIIAEIQLWLVCADCNYFLGQAKFIEVEKCSKCEGEAKEMKRFVSEVNKQEPPQDIKLIEVKECPKCGGVIEERKRFIIEIEEKTTQKDITDNWSYLELLKADLFFPYQEFKQAPNFDRDLEWYVMNKVEKKPLGEVANEWKKRNPEVVKQMASDYAKKTGDDQEGFFSRYSDIRSPLEDIIYQAVRRLERAVSDMAS